MEIQLIFLLKGQSNYCPAPNKNHKYKVENGKVNELVFPTLFNSNSGGRVMATNNKKPIYMLPKFDEPFVLSEDINDLPINQRLKYARLKNKLSIAELCRKINFTPDMYAKYEKGIVTLDNMNISILVKISKLCNIDVLDDYHKFKLKSSEVVIRYMDDKKISIRKLAKQLNVSVTTVKNWRSQKCCPSYQLWKTVFQNYFKDNFTNQSISSDII